MCAQKIPNGKIRDFCVYYVGVLAEEGEEIGRDG